MSTIINQKGQLWRVISEYRTGYYQCELVEDAPTFKFSKGVDSWIAITAEGRLYDTHKSEYLDCEICNFVEIRSIRNRDYMAITEDGDLYSIINNVISLVAHGIIFFTSTADGNDFIFIDQDGQWFSRNAGLVPQPNSKIPDFKEIIDVDDGCLITHSAVYFLPFNRTRGRNLAAQEIPLEGSYLFSGVYENEVYEGRRELLIIESKENGELLLSMNSIGRNNAWNQLIEDMHQSSPWMGFIKFNGEPALYNRDGHSYYIKEDFALTSTEIPPHILSCIPSRLKNPMTKI